MTAVILWALCALPVLVFCGRACQWNPDEDDLLPLFVLVALSPVVVAYRAVGFLFVGFCWLVRRVTA